MDNSESTLNSTEMNIFYHDGDGSQNGNSEDAGLESDDEENVTATKDASESDSAMEDAENLLNEIYNRG